MKKILLTLAKWFHVDLTEIKYVEVEKVVEVPVERIVEKKARKRNAKGQFVKED